jgi:carboxymethylenebutenolidase
MTRYETIRDGFDAYLALPDAGRGPGVVVFQEIFGINDNIRGICDRLAGEGYVALAPDVFWRLEKRFERKDESGMQDGMAMVSKLDFGLAAQDAAATVAHLRGLPETVGRVGAIGFCLGGTLTYLCATSTDVDAAVPYYGSGIHDMLDRADRLVCPTLFHYGVHDPVHPGRADRAGSRRRWRASRTSRSSAMRPGTPSPTGTPRRCTTSAPPPRRGNRPAPSWCGTWPEGRCDAAAVAPAHPRHRERPPRSCASGRRSCCRARQ